MVKLKICKYAVAGCALGFIAIFIALGIIHIAYPFEIETVEGQAIEQVRLLLSGNQFYVKPSIEFTPNLYMPLYYYISALFAKLFGPNFFSLRLVSFLFSLGCMFLIYIITKKQSGSRFAGIIAAGLYAATYEVSGVWMDIARVDSVFLFFLLLALYYLQGTSWKSQAAAGISLFLSFMSKQTAAVIAVPLFAYSLIVQKRRSCIFIGTSVILSAVAILILNHFSEGWFMIYLLIAFKHEVERRFYADFWSQDLGILSVAGVFILFYLFDRRKELFRNLYFFAAVGMIGASWASRLHTGGWNNVLFPAYAIVAILCGLGVAKLLQEENQNRRLAIYLMLLVQFAVLFYNPFTYIPAAGSVETGEKFVRLVAQLPDPVLIPNHPYILSQLGKKSNAHTLTMIDFFRSKDRALGNELQDQLQQALREQRYSAIIMDNNVFNLYQSWFVDTLNEYYVQNSSIFTNEPGFWTVSGVRVRPETLYLPNRTQLPASS